MSESDPLHFPRANLARNCFLMWEELGSSLLSVYGQRRIGKTTFLQTDLVAEGERRDYRMEYFSFMGKRDPQRAFVEWLVDMVRGGGVNRAGAGTKVAGKVNVGVFELSAEAVLSDPADSGLEKLMRQLAKQEPKLVLMLDEFQELAAEPKNRDFIASLRTAMDCNRGIKAIFTGSSMTKLQTVFEDVHAPFYNSTSSVPFPPLGKDFTDFLADHFARISPSPVFTRENAMIAHCRLHGVTKDTREFLRSLVTMPSTTNFSVALELYAAKVEAQFGRVEAAHAELASDLSAEISVGALFDDPAPSLSH